MHPAWWEAGDAELEGNPGLARVGDSHQQACLQARGSRKSSLLIRFEKSRRTGCVENDC